MNLPKCKPFKIFIAPSKYKSPVECDRPSRELSTPPMEGKEGDPHGLIDTLHVPNPEKYPAP